jgi:predicted house-cleaning noncanonical NTP pyrophosphatase (MazG superfamily)
MAEEKLVRNKTADFSREKKDGRVFRVATPGELPYLLSRKLQEECAEVCFELLNVTIDPAKLAEELADCCEVIHEIGELINLYPVDLRTVMFEKCMEKGSFSQHVVLTIKEERL